MVTKTHLKHLLDVVVLGLEQLAPGGQVAVGEDAAGLQHPVSVTLQTNTDTQPNQSINLQTDRLQYVRQMIQILH